MPQYADPFSQESSSINLGLISKQLVSIIQMSAKECLTSCPCSKRVYTDWSKHTSYKGWVKIRGGVRVGYLIALLAHYINFVITIPILFLHTVKQSITGWWECQRMPSAVNFIQSHPAAQDVLFLCPTCWYLQERVGSGDKTRDVFQLIPGHFSCARVTAQEIFIRIKRMQNK